jgi:hypothetical protein
MTSPNQELLSDERIPTVTLAGLTWPIPKLAIKQNEIILPILLRRAPQLAALAAGQGGMTTEFVHDCSTIVYWGLTRGHKGFTREEFDDMPIEVTEVLNAVTVVGQQTGLLKAREATGPLVPAAVAPLSPIGSP